VRSPWMMRAYPPQNDGQHEGIGDRGNSHAGRGEGSRDRLHPQRPSPKRCGQQQGDIEGYDHAGHEDQQPPGCARHHCVRHRPKTEQAQAQAQHGWAQVTAERSAAQEATHECDTARCVPDRPRDVGRRMPCQFCARKDGATRGRCGPGPARRVLRPAPPPRTRRTAMGLTQGWLRGSPPAAGGDGLSVHSSLQTRRRSHGVRGPAAPHQTILASRIGGVGQAINVTGLPFGTARVGSGVLRRPHPFRVVVTAGSECPTPRPSRRAA